jgi:hypothetical protein
MRRWTAAFWTLAAIVAVLWPSRFLGPLDGAPLDAPADALVIGLLLPSLWWLSRTRLRSNVSQAAVVALLVWKAGTGLIAQQQGACMTAAAAGPVTGTAMTMRIDEPRGVLRSWDLRADLWSERPRCTAIVTRPLPETRDFPIWFVNITDQIIGRRDFTIEFSAFTSDGRPLTSTVAGADRGMSYLPEIDGRPLTNFATVTTAEAGLIDRLLAPWAWLVTLGLVLVLIGALAADVARWPIGPAAAVWIVAAAAGAVMLARAGDPWQRAAGALAFGAVMVPMRQSLRNPRGAFLLVGVPWLAFFAAKSFDQIGRFSTYSTDDWLAYQVAGYRIFMNGFWIEGGSPTFDYQPLYRWITGALHLVFGDSSVGEVYLDAASLLIGALLAFQLVRMAAGFRWGLAAAAMTLTTFTAGTAWHFPGRGLSEITAAGFAFLAMWFMLRARLGAARWVAAATAMAVLMFLSRLNHLLWMAWLPALLLPIAAEIRWSSVTRALRRVRVRAAVVYAAGCGAALLLFMGRTWHYTGDFSLFHGTSLRHNDTGLRPWTMLDGAVWSKVWHSLQSLAWMNEPPQPDPRAVVMAAGCVIGVLALLQVPSARRLPAALVLTAAGSAIGAFFAHAHGYPGRFSLHAVPLASAITAIAASRAAAR